MDEVTMREIVRGTLDLSNREAWNALADQLKAAGAKHPFALREEAWKMRRAALISCQRKN